MGFRREEKPQSIRVSATQLLVVLSLLGLEREVANIFGVRVFLATLLSIGDPFAPMDKHFVVVARVRKFLCTCKAIHTTGVVLCTSPNLFPTLHANSLSLLVGKVWWTFLPQAFVFPTRKSCH